MHFSKCVDENELDIPNGESNVENEEEDQNDAEEQEYYVEGLYTFNVFFKLKAQQKKRVLVV